MKMTQEFMVLGIKRFKGEIEGKFYDNTKIIVVMDMSERSGNAAGKDTSELPFGDSSNYEKFDKLNYPLQANLEVLMTTKGFECHGMTPIKAQKAV